MTTVRISEFDTWQAGYGLATVSVFNAGTTDLAAIFIDETCETGAANPQTLAERTDGDISYGKFSQPLYTQASYQLLINSIDETGVVRPPLVTLSGADASLATAIAAGGSQAATLASHLARRIDVRDFGAFIAVGGVGASASTNNATLAAALAEAASAGAGFVEAPPGTYQVTTFTVPRGVVLRGQDKVATTLQSTAASAVATIGGSRAGFANLTLDGVTLVGGSIGIYAANKDEIVLDNVEIKRFATGIDRRGGARCAWLNADVSNCSTGAKLYGDAASGNGAACSFNSWTGGRVELCGTNGIDLRNIDRDCTHNLFANLIFDTNTATALKLVGARGTTLRDCQWTGNTTDLDISDQTPATTSNTVIGLDIEGGEMSGGALALAGNLETIKFAQVTLTGITATLTSPLHNLLIEDCRETSVTIAGDATAWRRNRTGNYSAASVVTTDITPTKLWATTLVPGQHIYLTAKVIGRRRNSPDYVFSFRSRSARRPGSQLGYQLQTGNFTLGTTLTGGTSGATARVVNDVDAGATGTLTLYNIVGTFVNGEIITDGVGGSATANGAVVDKRSVILTSRSLLYDGQTVNFTVGSTVTGGTSGATARITADADGGATGTLTITDIDGTFIDNEALTDAAGGAAVVNGGILNLSFDIVEQSYTLYNEDLVANNAQVELRVTGAAGHTIEWIVNIEVISNPDV
jgi:hypothetical protein